jgi:hypothetical protein
MLMKRVIVGIAVLLMVASLVFPWSASAHNIDVKKATEVAKEYAREVIKESQGKYLHFKWRCGRMYPGHNHYVGCTIEYQNAKDKAAGVYTCKETININMKPNRGKDIYDLYASHTSFRCGNRILKDNKVG